MHQVARNAAIALILSAALSHADDLPKADTILDKYVEVTGGKAAYAKNHSEMTKGTMELAGLKGTLTQYMVEPDKSYSEVEIPGIGKVRDGSDGKVYWEVSAIAGPRIKEGAEKSQAMLTSMNSELRWRDLFKEAKTTGTDKVDGKDCYKVVLTPKEGSPLTECYDEQSGLMVKATMTLQGPMGEQTFDMFPTEYRKEGDILMAHKMKQSVAGQEITFTVNSVTFNPEIPKNLFDLPDEIKALADKK